MTENNAQTEQPAATQATTDNGAGSQPEATTLVDRADALVKRMEAANAEAKTLLERQERILANERLGGRSVAGHTAVDPVKEKIDEDVRRALSAWKMPSKK